MTLEERGEAAGLNGSLCELSAALSGGTALDLGLLGKPAVLASWMRFTLLQLI